MMNKIDLNSDELKCLFDNKPDEQYFNRLNNKTGYSNRENEGVVIELFDEIGFFGATGESVNYYLKRANGSDITLKVHSPGGDYLEAISIYNSILDYPGKVTALINGVALSAASFIVMAADHIKAYKNSEIMIHNVSVGVVGDKRRLESVLNALNGMDKALASVYSDRTKRNIDEIVELMNSESWFTADEALNMGFIDEVINKNTEFSAHFDLSNYKKAPKVLIDDFKEIENGLVSLASKMKA